MITTTPSPLALIIFLIKALLIPVVKSQATATASIEYTTGYLEQVDCVRNCIWSPNDVEDIRAFIGCGSPVLNGCFCDPNSSLSVSTFLSTCVMASCSSATSNVNTAISVYSSYCVEGGDVLTVTSDNEASSPTSTTGKLTVIVRARS